MMKRHLDITIYHLLLPCAIRIRIINTNRTAIISNKADLKVDLSRSVDKVSESGETESALIIILVIYTLLIPSTSNSIVWLYKKAH
jgi:hypothetical protein